MEVTNTPQNRIICQQLTKALDAKSFQEARADLYAPGLKHAVLNNPDGALLLTDARNLLSYEQRKVGTGGFWGLFKTSEDSALFDFNANLSILMETDKCYNAGAPMIPLETFDSPDGWKVPN